MDDYFILCAIIQYHFILLLKLFLRWLLRALSIGYIVPLAYSHHCVLLSTSLLSRPGMSHFSKEPWFLLLENGIRNQDLATGCAHCYWDVTGSLNRQSSEYMCEY